MGSTGPRTLWMEGLADILKTSPSSVCVCYHAEVGHSTSKALGINRGEPKNWEALGLRPWDGRRGWPKETPRPTCVIFPNVDVLHLKGLHHREPPKLGNAVASPPWTSPWLPPEQSPPHMCYHVKFGRCASRDVPVGRRDQGNPKIGECWGPPHVLPCRISSF